MAVSISSARFKEASGTKKRPSGNEAALPGADEAALLGADEAALLGADEALLREATSSASRVLPIPPGPTSVKRRQPGSSSSALISFISCDLPIKGVGVNVNRCILVILVLS